MRKVVWVTGAGGLIGSALVTSARTWAPVLEVKGLSRNVIDLADHAGLNRLFHADRPACIIHCAAISKSPACEANPSLAHTVNVGFTERLAELARAVPFVFFSSDLVFDGARGSYVETDSPNPLSVYAATKSKAEAVIRQHPDHLIIRTSLNGGTSPTGDRGFNEEMKRAWKEGRMLNLFTDEFRSPIAAVITARAVWELLTKEARGVFHIAGSERLSRFEIGQALAEAHPELNPQIQAGSLKDYTGPPRSPDTSLNCAKAQRLLSFPLPGLREWLAEPGNVL